MTAPDELMRLVVETLNDLEVPYFITGSVASGAFGEYRTTADVDIVARIEERHARLLCAAFPTPRYYVDEQMVRDAIRGHSQFNILDTTTAFKADIMIPGSSQLDRNRFARARRIQPANADRTYWFSSPEDVILKKLQFHLEGGSDKHLRDISGIVKTMGTKLETAYIDEWAATLGVLEVWRAVQARVAKK